MTKAKPTSHRRLFFDIETAPNLAFIWRPGSKISVGHQSIIVERAIICICWKWEHEKRVHYLTWDEKQNDRTMLKEFVDIMESADEVIGHNSKKFDTKWVRGRCLFHRIPMIPQFIEIDTLTEFRKYFNLNCNKLDYLGNFLGHGSKVDYGGLDTYKKIILKNNKSALKRMVDYCKNDVVLLQNIYEDIKPYIIATTHRGMAEGKSRLSCPECGSENYRKGCFRIRASGVKVKQVSCNDCGKFWTLPEKVYFRLLAEQEK